jgi:hypothetical protein
VRKTRIVEIWIDARKIIKSESTTIWTNNMPTEHRSTAWLWQTRTTCTIFFRTHTIHVHSTVCFFAHTQKQVYVYIFINVPVVRAFLSILTYQVNRSQHKVNKSPSQGGRGSR